MSWRDHVTAALLGTERGGAPPALPAALEDTLKPGGGDADREARFLARAGALALWRRAGWRPAGQGDASAWTDAPPEEGAPLSPASRAHLDAMLARHHEEVLPEWLAEAARRGRRLPPELLPALLDRARPNRAMRVPLLAAGGARGRWLAAQHPPWRFAGDDLVPAHWETGSRDQRAAFLRLWRGVDPADAREKLAAVWKAEPADARAAFLATLAEGLAEADEPLLEQALDDRAKDVRLAAVDLLARLPGSAFAARMVARAEPLLAFKRGGLLSRASLEVTLPPEPDAAALRDGLDAKILGPPGALGEKATRLMLLLAAVPLGHWTRTWQRTPEQILAAADKNEFGTAVVLGWGLAALRQRDAAWAEALLDAPIQPRSPQVTGLALFGLLPAAGRAARLAENLREDGLQAREANYAAWQEVEQQVASFPEFLPVDVARELLRTLRRVAAARPRAVPWQLAHARTWLLKVPPALLPDAVHGWPDDNESAAAMLTLLAFRHEAHAALARP